MVAYLDFCRHWNDFKGKTSRSGFWTAIAIHCVFGFLLFLILTVMLASNISHNGQLSCLDYAQNAFGLLSTVPLCSMILRRLRDAGYNKANAWKLLIPGIFVIALFLPGCHKNEIEP